MKKKYQICIDLTCDIEGKPLEEAEPIMCSPLYDTEEEADAWYRSCHFEFPYIDIIMIVWDEKAELILDSFVY